MKTDRKGAERFIKDKEALAKWRQNVLYTSTPSTVNCKLTCIDLLKSVKNSQRGQNENRS